MNVYIINAAPGVGKTSLLNIFNEKAINSIAILDGDDVGRIIPLKNSLKWLDLIQDNIVECSKNFKVYGVDAVIIVFVFPSMERLNRLKTKFEKLGYSVYHIILYCDDSEVERRIIKRNTFKIMTVKRAIELNKLIQSMEASYKIDTTKINTQEVAEKVYNIINDTLSWEIKK